MQPGFRADSAIRAFVSTVLPLKKRIDTNIKGEKRACISCGLCNECCPRGLYPNILHRYVERNKFDEPLVQFGIFDCLDCNLCTYVCPSKIPVAALLKQGKAKLAEEGFQPQIPELFVDLHNIEIYRGLQ
jgi:Na+-translocating ferredoxin:NAD+ oxidoreductase RnfC subunit